jgi:hypothetical protein
VAADGLSVESVNAWAGGASFEDAISEEERAWAIARLLWNRLENARSYQARRRIAQAVLSHIDEHLQLEQQPLPPILGLMMSCDVADLLRCGQMLRAMVDVVMKRTNIAFTNGRVQKISATAQIRSAVEPHAAALRQLAAGLLAEAGEPLDDWHQASTVGHLLSPHMGLFTVSNLYWLPPPPPGQSSRERQYAAAVGATDKTERLGLRAKRDLQLRAGASLRHAKPGPKRGSHHRSSPEQQQFDAYLLDRARAGFSPAVLSQDGEVQRLYRAWKRDHAAVVDERVVRHHLRKQRSK